MNPYRNYYLLPPSLGSFAVDRFKNAKETAIKAKREFLDKESAVAIVRQENIGIGLVYVKKIERAGFTLPTSYEGYWLLKPKKNTLIGRRIQSEMDDVCQLLEKWQWSTETALGLYESVYSLGEFHNTVCYALPDGSVAVSQHPSAKIRLSNDHKIDLNKFEVLIKDAL